MAPPIRVPCQFCSDLRSSLTPAESHPGCPTHSAGTVIQALAALTHLGYTQFNPTFVYICAFGVRDLDLNSSCATDYVTSGKPHIFSE